MPVAELTRTHLTYQDTTYSDRGSPEVPPLENGDRLTVKEFERRYNAMPQLKKAELIEGRVYMSSAVKRTHGDAHADVITWVGMYRVSTPGIRLSDNVTVRLDKENEPQPDVSLRFESKKGSCQVSEDDYLEGAPELIVEVAASSASYDLHEKLDVYRRNGVQEYLVWQVYENRLDWFVLEAGKYLTLKPDADGVLRSRVFPGLFLAVDALLAGDMERVNAVLQQGLQSDEHNMLVQSLREAQ